MHHLLATLRLPFLALFLFAPPSLTAKDEHNTPVALALHLQSKLPDWWTVSYAPKYHLIEIRRDMPTPLIFSNLSESADEKSPTSEQFYLGLCVEPLLSISRYKKLKALNNTTEKQLVIYRSILQSITGKPDSFSPRTELQRKQVEQYKNLQGTIRQLPDFYFRDVSLSWGLPDSTERFRAAVDEKTREECAEVTRIIIKSLAQYPNN